MDTLGSAPITATGSSEFMLQTFPELPKLWMR